VTGEFAGGARALAYWLFMADSVQRDKEVRPMSHLQFYRAILLRNFIARQNRKCDNGMLHTATLSHK